MQAQRSRVWLNISFISAGKINVSATKAAKMRVVEGVGEGGGGEGRTRGNKVPRAHGFCELDSTRRLYYI